jgi:hypothetical protein
LDFKNNHRGNSRGSESLEKRPLDLSVYEFCLITQLINVGMKKTDTDFAFDLLMHACLPIHPSKGVHIYLERCWVVNAHFYMCFLFFK